MGARIFDRERGCAMPFAMSLSASCRPAHEDEIKTWCEESLHHPYYVFGQGREPFEIAIENASDAVLFRLRWSDMIYHVATGASVNDQ